MADKLKMAAKKIKTFWLAEDFASVPTQHTHTVLCIHVISAHTQNIHHELQITYIEHILYFSCLEVLEFSLDKFNLLCAGF